MDIVNPEMDLAQSAMESDLAEAAQDEARVDQAYVSLAAQISAGWLTHYSASGDAVRISGDFLHPFFLMPPKFH